MKTIVYLNESPIVAYCFILLGLRIQNSLTETILRMQMHANLFIYDVCCCFSKQDASRRCKWGWPTDDIIINSSHFFFVRAFWMLVRRVLNVTAIENHWRHESIPILYILFIASVSSVGMRIYVNIARMFENGEDLFSKLLL